MKQWLVSKRNSSKPRRWKIIRLVSQVASRLAPDRSVWRIKYLVGFSSAQIRGEVSGASVRPSRDEHSNGTRSIDERIRLASHTCTGTASRSCFLSNRGDPSTGRRGKFIYTYRDSRRLYDRPRIAVLMAQRVFTSLPSSFVRSTRFRSVSNEKEIILGKKWKFSRFIRVPRLAEGRKRATGTMAGPASGEIQR